MTALAEALVAAAPEHADALSHCGYEWETRAFCGAPFKWRTSERPTDRPVCVVCDAIAEAKANVGSR